MKQQFITWWGGHTTVEIDLNAEGAIKEAERIFTETRQGNLALKRPPMVAIRTKPLPAEVISQYDIMAEVIEFVVPLMGG